MLTQPLTKDQVLEAIQAMPQQEFLSIRGSRRNFTTGKNQ